MNIDLDTTDREDLQALANAEGKDPGQLLRELVHEAISERKRNSEPKGAKPSRVRFADIYGVGKEIWQSEDAQAYVNRLRDEWR